MPIVLFALALGIAIGYWICRTQLKGKFILVEEEMEAATWRAIEIEKERGLHPAPPTPTPTPPPLSQAWGLPNYHHNRPQPTKSLPPPLYNGDKVVWLHPPKDREETPQYSAAQIIGDKFYAIPPDYPGGIEAWKDEHPMKGRGVK